MEYNENLARSIFTISHLTGEFKLRSGMVSNEYFDKYLFESRPDVLAQIAAGLEAFIPSDTEVLAGLELGGVPIATALSLRTGIPAAFVRKKAKDYGTAKVAEGAELKGKKVLIVEDVITSGGQVILSAADLRELGAALLGVVCVIDRQQGGRKALEENGLKLDALFTMEQLKAAASQS